MKKLIVNFVGLRGGGLSYAYEMVKGLASNDCFLYVIISSKMENIDRWRRIPNIQLFEVKGYSNKFNFIINLIYFYCFEARIIKKQLKSIKDINAVYLPMSSYWAWFIQRILKNYRMIYTLHDVIPHDNQFFSIPWLFSNKLAKEADDIIILSECFVENIHKKYQKGYNNIHVLPLGTQKYYDENNSIHNNLYDINSEITFLFYGRIEDYKGLDILAKAYKIITEEYDRVHLTIAGNGDFSKYIDLYNQIESTKLTIINRWIKDDEVVDLFNKKNVVSVLPYKNATQSGIIPIAMQFKSLVIATNCAGLVEQVSDRETGFLIRKNSVDDLVCIMRYVIDNWKDMAKIISNAEIYINGLTWDNITKKMIDFI